MHHDPDFGGAPAHDPRRRGWLLLGGIVLAIAVIVIAVVRIGSDGDGEEPDSSSGDTVEVADDRVDRPEGGPDGPAPESAAEGATVPAEPAPAESASTTVEPPTTTAPTTTTTEPPPTTTTTEVATTSGGVELPPALPSLLEDDSADEEEPPAPLRAQISVIFDFLSPDGPRIAAVEAIWIEP